MDYKKIGETYYIRMDRDDEVIANILDVCKKESITSAVFSGIGGCKSAELQVFIPGDWYRILEFQIIIADECCSITGDRASLS